MGTGNKKHNSKYSSFPFLFFWHANLDVAVSYTPPSKKQANKTTLP